MAVEMINLNWETDDIYYRDPVYDYAFCVGARGTADFKAEGYGKALKELDGTENLEQLLNTEVRTYLPMLAQEQVISLFELDGRLEKVSKDLKELLNQKLEDYGICAEVFWIKEIKMPEEDPVYKKLGRIHNSI